MLQRRNPLSLRVTGELRVTPLEKQINDLVIRIKETDRERSDWLRKQLMLIKLRFGVRKPRSAPWKGASNITVPVIDKTLRRWRPGIASLVLDADPVAYFRAEEASDYDPARTVEPFFTWLFVEYMRTTGDIMLLVDLLGSRGHTYSRQGWKYRTQRSVRVVRSQELWPGGVQQEITAQIQQATATTPDRVPSPEELVVAKLADEYGLDPRDPAEGPMLATAAAELLAGKEYITLTYREVIEDRPDFKALDPMNVIVPPDEDPEHASFFAVIHDRITADHLRQMADDEVLQAGAVQKLLEKRPKTVTGGESGDASAGTLRDAIRRTEDLKAGVQDRSTSSSRVMYTLWEVYCHLQLAPGEARRRCVLWYCPSENHVLALTPYVLPLKGWPIVCYEYNRDGKRPIDNRGIPEMLADAQKMASAYHNMRIDAGQILLSPVVKCKGDAQGNTPALDWRPGGKISVRSPTDVEPMIHDLRVLAQMLQEEQVANRLAEDYIGTFDATLSNLNESRERRTATEVQAIQTVAGNIFGLDAKLFATQLGRTFTQIWQLYEEFGPEEIFFRVAGEAKPRLAKKSEICKNYDISAAGTPANTQRSVMLTNIERIMPVLLNGQIAASGTVDVAELVRAWVSLVNLNLAKKIIRPPEEAAAVQQVLQAAALSSGQEAPPF